MTGRFTIPPLLLHLSLLLIATGAVATWLGRESRSVTLSQGTEVDAGFSAPLALDSFVVVTYPGGVAPRDFRSYIRVGARSYTVAVNSPATVEGSMVRQEKCDSLGRSTLEISRDPAGLPIVYAGFLLFAIGGIGVLVDPKGRFRRLLPLWLLPCAFTASAAMPGLPADKVSEIAMKQVIWNGRVTSMHTASTEFCRSVAGTSHPGNLNAVQLTASLVLYPEDWSSQPLLRIENNELSTLLGIKGHYAAVNDLFDNSGAYRLKALYTAHPELEEAILDLDEKHDRVRRLIDGELISPVPEGMAIPQWRLLADRLNTDIPFTLIFFPPTILLGLLSFARPRLLKWALILLVWQTAGWMIRWCASGTIPLSNGGETMLFLSIALMAASLLTGRRQPLLGAGGILTAGFAGLVAWLSLRNPALSPVMPVLHSPWLSIHVTLVMTAYALLALTFVASVAGMFRPSKSLSRISMALLPPAVIMLGLGIITGSVWAQVSWGRYWAWDPKETWALITLLVYAVPLHFRLGDKGLRIYLTLAFLSVLMTYFGVNFLSSVHAYQ